MEDYRSNSHKAKAEAKEAAEKKVDKVVTGNVKRKKKSEVSKFKDVFISEDVSNVKSYIFLDVLVPADQKSCLGYRERRHRYDVIWGQTKRQSRFIQLCVI